MPTIEQVLRFIQTLFPGQLVLYPPQLAQVMGRSEKALKHLIDRGALPFSGKKIGNRWCVDIFRVAEWLVAEADDATVVQEKPTSPTEKPTRPRRATASTRRGLGAKLLEMREEAATALRRTVSSVVNASVILEFVQELLQPLADDSLELEASLDVSGAGDVAERLCERFHTLAGAAERVADLRCRLDVVGGCVRVARGKNLVYECSLAQAELSDWRATFEGDERFSAMLGLIEHQIQRPCFNSYFIDVRVPIDWFARQSLAVRREVQGLFAFAVDADFFSQLAAKVPLVPEAGLVSLYLDAWSCLPSKRVFEFAIAHHWSSEMLAQCFNDAEVALATPELLDDFEAFFPVDEQYDDAVNWLREQAYRTRIVKFLSLSGIPSSACS